MRIDFEVDGVAGVFARSGMTGRATLRLGAESITLQSPWNPATHFSTSTERTWRRHLAGHDVVVAKQRARIAAGVRQADFAIWVDGVLVRSERGY